MLKIGHFARLARVSVKTLHHYDKLDLLKPQTVDAQTGYRYYGVEQRERLQQILDLKELGLSLEAIREVLLGGMSTDSFHLLLRNKHCDLLALHTQIQTQLTLIETRLDALKETNMSKYTVTLKQVDAILVASRRVEIPNNDAVPEYLLPAFQETIAHVLQHQEQMSGPGTAVWHSPHDADTNEVVEATIPLIKTIPPTEQIHIRKLPASYVASVTHRGTFDDFTLGYETLVPWIDAHGYTICGPYREVYHKFHPGETDDTIVEIQFPVVKAT